MIMTTMQLRYVGIVVVDCGIPEFPSTGTVSLSNTTVGGVGTFQCEEGLVLSGSNTTTCTDTVADTLPGEWSPDPTHTNCRNLCKMSEYHRYHCGLLML